jgi:hypothetical protein
MDTTIFEKTFAVLMPVMVTVGGWLVTADQSAFREYQKLHSERLVGLEKALDKFVETCGKFFESAAYSDTNRNRADLEIANISTELKELKKAGLVSDEYHQVLNQLKRQSTLKIDKSSFENRTPQTMQDLQKAALDMRSLLFSNRRRVLAAKRGIWHSLIRAEFRL